MTDLPGDPPSIRAWALELVLSYDASLAFSEAIDAAREVVAYVMGEAEKPERKVPNLPARMRKARIKELVEAGWKPSDIAADIGMKVNAVRTARRRIKRETGIPPAPVGRPRHDPAPNGGA